MPPGNNAGHDVTAVTGRELAGFLEGGGQIRMRPAVAAIYDVENRLFANNPDGGFSRGHHDVAPSLAGFTCSTETHRKPYD